MPGWGFERHDGTLDEAAAADYWRRHRERLLASWIRDKPGGRPWAWWKFDAIQYEGGRRRTIGGRVHPFDDPLRKLRVARSDDATFWRKAYALHWGLPASFIFPFDEDLYRDYMANRLDSKIFEPEWAFLQRRGLLLKEDSLH